MRLLYGVMRVGDTLGDIIRLPGTIHWPLEHIYTRVKSLTSNLLILLFFNLLCPQMSVMAHGITLWGHEGRGYPG